MSEGQGAEMTGAVAIDDGTQYVDATKLADDAFAVAVEEGDAALTLFLTKAQTQALHSLLGHLLYS